jgi:hypothetical protein
MKISSDLDRFKRARVLGFIRPVVPLAGLPLCDRARSEIWVIFLQAPHKNIMAF